jgi:hypothetical protein
MPVKTNTPEKSETQERIQQLELGVDWHAEHYRVGIRADAFHRHPFELFEARYAHTGREFGRLRPSTILLYVGCEVDRN